MSLLITPTLFNSWDWWQTAPEKNGWKERATNDLNNMLNRAPFEPNEYMARGMRFEDAVYKHANNENRGGSELFNQVCDLVKGGRYQYRLKKIIVVDGIEYCLYGKADVVHPGKKVIDIKTTQNYKGKGSYLKQWQHVFYCYIAKVRDFTYLVVEMYTDDGKDVMENVYEVDYHTEDYMLQLEQVRQKIREWNLFLADHPDMKEAFETRFSLYN